MSQYTEIRDLAGREPVGAVLRIGRKGPKGAPIERDRFYIVSRYENERGERPLLHDFESFNSLDPAHRKAFRAYLVHPQESDVWAYRLSARVLGAHWKPYPRAHPNMRPICEGDGERATRLHGIAENGDEDWREIDCPNRLCEFRTHKKCKPWAKIYFMPRWREGWADRLPSPLMMLSTGSWNTVANFKGFFERTAQIAEECRLADWSYVGLPVIFHLGEKKDRKQGHVFPVVDLSWDGDLVSFFAGQRARLEQAGATTLQLPEHAGAGEPAEFAAEVDAADYRDVTPGVPGQGALFGEAE